MISRSGRMLALVLILPSSVVWAGSTVLPPVQVKASTNPQDSRPGIADTHISLSNYQNTSDTLPEILMGQAGVHLTRFGGLDQSTSLSIRGSESSEVVTTLDGIPLNSAQKDGLDLSPFLMDDLDSVDVIRGGGSFDLGFGAPAGEIALHSSKIPKGQKTSARLEYGSFNTLKAHTSFSTAKENWRFLSSISYSGSSGNFSFEDDNGTPLNAGDDLRRTRSNNETRTLYPFLKMIYDFDAQTRLEWVSHLILKHAGVPGITSNFSSNANLSSTEWLSGIKLRRSHFFSDKNSFEPMLYWRTTKSQFSDRSGEVGLGGSQDNDDDSLLFGFKPLLRAQLARHQMLSFFSLYQFENFRPENFTATPAHGGVNLQHTFNMGVSDELDFADHRLQINPSVIWENKFNSFSGRDPSFAVPGALVSNSDSEVSTRLGVQWQLRRDWSLEGQLGRASRFPLFPEMFGDRGGIVGNPALKPQRATNLDLGFHWQPMKKSDQSTPFQFSALYFSRWVDNLIQFQQNSGYARAENVGQARIQGVESSAGLQIKNHWRLSSNYTFQWAKDQALVPGNYLPGRPRHEIGVEGRYWVKKIELFSRMNWVDSNYLDPLNTRLVSSRMIVNSGVVYKPSKAISLSFEGKNLSGDAVVDVLGFPLPGRGYFGKISWNR